MTQIKQKLLFILSIILFILASNDLSNAYESSNSINSQKNFKYKVLSIDCQLSCKLDH
jgi:hypothetical protein